MATKNIKNNDVFADFAEYWFYAKYLDKSQRDTIFNSLSSEQQKNIQKSYHVCGWEDVFMRNHVDKRLDELKEEYNIDLLRIKYKVLSGKSHFMKKKDWDFIVDVFMEYDKKHTKYIFEGIDVSVENKDTVLLFRS
jgi:hypothetical protein